MATQMVNGRVVPVQAEPDGSIRADKLRKAAGVPDDRQMILQLPDGSNRVINPGENVHLPPDQFFFDAPGHIRGSRDYPSLRLNLQPHDQSNDDDDEYEADCCITDDAFDFDDDDDRDQWDEDDDHGDDFEDDLDRDLVQLSRHFPLWLDDDYRYVIVQQVKLPPGYDRDYIDLLVELPPDYPASPPGIGDNRIYMPPDVTFRGQRLRDLHSGKPKASPLGFGPWAWLCYEAIHWDPMSDELITLIEMIRADLTDPPTL